MRALLGILLASALLAAGCATGPGSRDKAGVRTVTLRMMVADFLATPTDQIARDFARRVQTSSGGRIRVEVDGTDNASLPGDYPQRVIREVRSGRADVVAVWARGWDGAGVTSLLPLEVPMLISSDAALDAVAADPVAGEMLAGVRPAGFEPLALVPESLGLLYGISHPLASPRSLRGATIRVRPTRLGYAGLAALGAEPEWIAGFRAQQLALSGELTGAVTFSDPDAMIAPGTFTANVPVYASAVTLAVSSSAWRRLDARQRQALLDAAAATRRAWAHSRPTVSGMTAKACRFGIGVAVADPRALAGFRTAFEPVSDRLERDPRARALVERIRKIDGAAPRARPTTCPARNG